MNWVLELQFSTYEAAYVTLKKAEGRSSEWQRNESSFHLYVL